MIVYPDGEGVFTHLVSKRGCRAALRQRAFRLGLFWSILAGVVAGGCHMWARERLSDMMAETTVYSSFCVLVAFVIVFRTNQSNQRFHDGTSMVYSMHADFCETASLLIAFARNSKVSTPDKILNFQHTAVRLLSMLGAACMIDLASGDDHELSGDWVSRYACDMVDIGSLDPGTLLLIEKSEHKPETVLQVVQHLMTSQVGGVLDAPPPLLTLAFQELGNGMIKYQEAMKLVTVPTPFPYMIIADALVLIYTCVTPLVMVAWTNNAIASVLFSMVQIFILWSLIQCSAELDNPFGSHLNDLNMGILQASYNKRLMCLLRCCGNNFHTPFVDAFNASIDVTELSSKVSSRPSVLRAQISHTRRRVMLPGKHTHLGSLCDPELTYLKLMDLRKESLREQQQELSRSPSRHVANQASRFLECDGASDDTGFLYPDLSDPILDERSNKDTDPVTHDSPAQTNCLVHVSEALVDGCSTADRRAARVDAKLDLVETAGRAGRSVLLVRKKSCPF